jgi:amino-acid N-acetyltransferase
LSSQDFILSVLQANPSARDSRFYLQQFAPPKESLLAKAHRSKPAPVPAELVATAQTQAEALMHPMAQSIIDPVHQHTGLVKIQGPFTDRQLASVAEGMVYLRRLGLIAILVLDREDWDPSRPDARSVMAAEVLRLADLIERAGGLARPMLEPILKRAEDGTYEVDNVTGLVAAIRHGEIPVLPPFALSNISQSTCVPANELILGLTRCLAELPSSSRSKVDLRPLRLMVINQEGGIPSYARGGTPHLSINLESEFDYINDTFVWGKTHPTSLSNLALMRDCLEVLPRTSSAIIVSHRSPKALIANLVTNRPAHSPSLHASSLPPFLQLQHTPTILRHGLPIRVCYSLKDVNLASLTTLLETSFGRTLDQEAYYARLEQSLDFMIVAGDCAAVAIVTREGPTRDVSYLDKFSILPSLQGDGTVDFLWGALRDETFGLGLLDALNNNGGLEGRGTGVDLVWRSRADNMINRWYFERSNGFAKLNEMGKGGVPGVLFWCDAEQRVEAYGTRKEGVPFVTREERGRTQHWMEVIGRIPRCVWFCGRQRCSMLSQLLEEVGRSRLD